MGLMVRTGNTAVRRARRNPSSGPVLDDSQAANTK